MRTHSRRFDRDNQWELFLAFIKWIDRNARFSKRRILKSLKAHEVSGMRVLEVPYIDTILILKRKDFDYREAISLLERAIHVELRRRAIIILQPISKLREILNRGEDILENMKNKS